MAPGHYCSQTRLYLCLRPILSNCIRSADSVVIGHLHMEEILLVLIEILTITSSLVPPNRKLSQPLNFIIVENSAHRNTLRWKTIGKPLWECSLGTSQRRGRLVERCRKFGSERCVLPCLLNGLAQVGPQVIHQYDPYDRDRVNPAITTRRAK
ncbi:hypothetical protein J6590_009731 [Homalodisca vitripennis]|nr:hypothetical protein J6590_009731 [Homalodisca vitripennis]